MKKQLITAAVVFIVLLAAFTALLCSIADKESTADTGDFAVAVNEIQQLIASGDAEEAQLRANELKAALAEYTPENTDRTAYLWGSCGICTVMIIAAFIYIWFAVLRPFEKLTDFAERIAGGDFDLPLNYERTNYFGKFTWAFDNMRREIVKARACEKEAIENNKTVIATLSHDIKTPIASIRAYTEGLEAGLDSTPEKRQKYLNVIMNKCDEVARLTDDMFLHSLSDLDKLKMNKQVFDLCNFVQAVTAEYSDVCLEKPMFSVSVNADRNRLAQIMGNIITNAAKYAKTKVDVRITRTHDEVSIHFRDYGGGIADEDIPFIFGKFYRGKNCGSEQGSGLGLYIVKYVMEQSGGNASLKNCDKGLEVTVILPVYEKNNFS